MNRMIELDDAKAKTLGFTSDRFGGGSYLWEDDDAIYVSFIESLHRGNFRALVAAIHADGKTVVVPAPLPRMKQIVLKNGYKHSVERSEGENVEVWKLPPQPQPSSGEQAEK